MEILVLGGTRKKRFEIFCCYAHKDREWLLALKIHLVALEREGLITLWDDTNISPGEEWEKEIHHHLYTAEILLLLVSANFIASDYAYEVEMKQAMERHERGDACIIPVILQPVDWQKKPFGKLQALPTDARPVTDWPDPNEAFYTVVKGIRGVVEHLEVRNPVDRVSYPDRPSRVQSPRPSYHPWYHYTWLPVILVTLLWLFTCYDLGKSTNLYSSCQFRRNSYYAVIGAMSRVFCLSYSSGFAPQLDMKASKGGEAGIVFGYETGMSPHEKTLLLLPERILNTS